jgi:hypothetical protein
VFWLSGRFIAAVGWLMWKVAEWQEQEKVNTQRGPSRSEAEPGWGLEA